MSDPSDKAKWDALAEMLGAKITQPERPAAPRPQPPSPPRVHEDVPAPPRKKANWDALAGELGIAGAAPADRGPEDDRGPEKAPERALKQPAESSSRERRPSAAAAPPAAPRERPDVVREEARQRPTTSVPLVEEKPLRRDGEERTEATGTSADRGPSRRRRRRGQRPKEDVDAREKTLARDAEEADLTEADLPADMPTPKPSHRDPAGRREPGEGPARTGHKSIPSWSEAISIMIDGNLANRSTRRKSSPGGSRGRARRGGRR